MRRRLAGAAALLGAAALVVSAVPAAADTAEPDTAAVRYLAAEKGRPERDFTVVGSAGGTVRVQQRHRGVDVLGGQYVVRMGRGRTVTGTSGRYFGGLTVGTEPEIDAGTAVARAVEAVRKGDEELTGTDRGLVVLPRGAGVLTRHVTVRGTRTPVLYEVYVEARSGYPVLRYSGIRTFGGQRAAGQRAAGQRAAVQPAAGRPGAAAATARGSGVRLDGRTVELGVERDEARDAYVLRDRSRLSGGGAVTTWDAKGRYVWELAGERPEGVREFGSPTPAFGAAATEAGAVDAHWGAGKVVDYYRDVLGRNGVDGRGGDVDSVVGLGRDSYAESLWDGTKVIYQGGAGRRVGAAALDVVGQQLTYGVIGSTAGLVPVGQSGALETAIADYFGKAVETDVSGRPMDAPDSGLMGASLCPGESPRACAARDLDDGRTTSKSFLGVTIATDNGGAHLNSTIFSGALWDMRKDLDHALADRIVYRALTAYLTPLDGFTEGRNAVLAAARELGAGPAHLRAVERAFDAHGIVPGWETAIGVDSDPLLGRVATDGRSAPGAGGGWWAASASDENGSEPYSVWAGRLDGTGERKLVSPNDGRYQVDPVTDGKTVVWKAYRGRAIDVLARPLAGGPVRTLYTWARTEGSLGSLGVDGRTVVFSTRAYKTPGRVVYVRMGEADPVVVRPAAPGRWASTESPSAGNGRIAYVDCSGGRCDLKLVDPASGRTSTVTGTDGGSPGTALTSRYVYWLGRPDWGSGLAAVRRADLDGTGVVDISPATGKDALAAGHLTASEDAVTVGAAAAPGATGHEALGKVWQFAPDGSRRDRVSCNRGEQLLPAAAGGRRVVWLDATTGSTDLVTRARPAGRCA
ncbi:M4 family metallopeptidase [Streptomyces caatingaensis]|uniref:M4 family metallopeptidase n=1 Tax=Streptomyces caatingaensis TaxID=1678637 RepID=UPI0030CA4968